jgi:hemerythrin-like domain-containing protein
MLMVHRAFRREFALAPGLVRRVDDGDTLRCRIVSDHLQFITTALHDHHGFEDGAVWPALLRRIPDRTTRHVRKVEGQHSTLDVSAAAMSAATACWGLGAAAQPRGNLAAVLERLASALMEHMDFEERFVVPLMEQHIRHDEWNQMIQNAASGVDADRMPLLFGMNMYEGDSDIVEQVIASMPSELQPAIRDTAERAYSQHAQLIHGTAKPPRSSEVHA